jgi:hypothetical protein
MVYAWCTDIVRILYGYCTDIVRILYRYCTHVVQMVYMATHKPPDSHPKATPKPEESRVMPFTFWNGVPGLPGFAPRPDYGFVGKALISTALPLPITTLPEIR